MDMNQLAPNLFVGAQMTERDLITLAKAGFTDVVCNRPDAEHPDGATSDKMARAAAKQGLTFHYLPIIPGEDYEAEAAQLTSLVAHPKAKVFAYCRSGMRAANAHSLGHSMVTRPAA